VSADSVDSIFDSASPPETPTAIAQSIPKPASPAKETKPVSPVTEKASVAAPEKAAPLPAEINVIEPPPSEIKKELPPFKEPPKQLDDIFDEGILSLPKAAATKQPKSKCKISDIYFL
jgi:hypothetical protein